MMTPKEMLKDHSESAIVDSIEENHIVFLVDLVRHAPEPYSPQIRRGRDMVRLYSGIPHPLTNGVYALQFDEKNLEKSVRENIEFFRSRKVTHMWWLGPNSSPKEIEGLLVDHGLMKREWDSPAMAMDLRQLDDSKLQELSERSGVEVRRVMTEEDLVRWGGVVRDAFGFDVALDKPFRGIYVNLLEREEYRPFLAEIDAEPVGASYSALTAGVAGLYNMGTLEEHRGKGIGQLVALAALLEGRNQGYEIGILSSSELAFKLYQKIGFKEYFRYRFYVDIPQ